MLTDEKGLPLAVVLSDANIHDIKLLEETLNHIMVLCPESDEEHPQNLCLDARYTGSQEKLSSVVICLISDPEVRKRRNWNVIRTFSPTAGALRLHTLFQSFRLRCYCLV